ncbi:MAG: DPP IV N-terminal domain-containing protein [Sphingobacteriales bacterium]|jgi:dipeptidyl-peptidase-4
MKYKLLLLLAIPMASFAQKKQLSEAQLLQNKLPEISKMLSPARWSGPNTYCMGSNCFDATTGKEIIASAPITGASRTKIVYTQNNDIYYAVGTQTPIRLTNDVTPEMNPTFSPDSQYIAFTRANDLYTIHIDSKKETRLTHDGSNLILNGYASWIYFEEILGRASRYRSFWWSPDNKTIAFMRMDQSMIPMFPIYSEEGQHGYLEETRYPKPGDKNPEVKIGFVSIEGSPIVWADFNEKDDQYFGMPTWAPNGKNLLVKWMNRDQNTLIVWDVNTTNGSKKKYYEEIQKAWIDLDDNDRFQYHEGMSFMLSDKDGWKNIYLLNEDGTEKRKLTNGHFWATDILYVDAKKKVIFFTAKKENSTRVDLYRVSLEGKDLKRLTFGDYTHSISLSPNGSYFIATYSNASTPPVMALYDTNGKLIRELANAKGSAFEEYELPKTEIVRIPSADGKYELPMRITWPMNYDPTKTYPVWISIYGGPNAGTVSDGWRLNAQQLWWAKEGFIQVAMDHRGSGHFGKAGLDHLHRNLGYWEMQDWIEHVKWLRSKGGDSTRVIIQGFSYGGYISSYALGYAPNYFTHAIAGGSVIDWSLYDTHYTERFMGTPKNNPEGYKSSSVLTHAPKIKGKLLLYHGSMDDNVHLQNSIQMVKKMQELKKDFDFMVYPGGRHGWGGPQQAHSQNMINRWVYKNVLNKETPKELIK